MRRAALLLLVPLLAAVPPLAGCLDGDVRGGGPTLVDATGTAVPIGDVSRIVPTSHDLTEILFRLGHGARVVAVPSWVDHETTPFPYDLGDRPRLGRPHVLNAEEVLAAAPTLVLEKDHPLQPTPLATQLRAAGVPVFVFDNDETLGNVRETYFAVAQILRHEDPDVLQRSTEEVQAFDARLDHVRAALAASDDPIPRAVYQLPAGFVAGTGTSADLLLRLAGASNLAADAGITGYGQVSRETLVDGDPERVVASRTAAGSAASFYGNPRYSGSTAAQLGPETLAIVDPATTALVGPRFADGVADLAAWLHPTAFDLFQVTHTYGQDADRDGLHVEITATAHSVRHAPVTFRFDPGDGSPVTDAVNGTFAHDYDTTGSYTARVLTIDAAGHIHERRFPVTWEA